MRVFLALIAALLGAVVGGALLGMVLGIVFTWIGGSFEGAAAMGGFSLGLPLGAVLGGGLALWQTLRKNGAHSGRVFAVLALAFIVTIVFMLVGYTISARS